MNIKQINEIFEFTITGGSHYQWKCYGENARYIDYENEMMHGSVIIDTKTQVVYEATVYSKNDLVPGPYRWLNQNTKITMVEESNKKNIDKDISWDEKKWIDLETEEDFLKKAKAIFKNICFDERVDFPVDLDDETILILAKEAHKRDITLNKMIEIMIKKFISEEK